MYQSTQSSTLQSKMNINTQMPLKLQRQVLEHLVMIAREVQIQDLNLFKAFYAANLIAISQDTWDTAQSEYSIKENQMLRLTIYRAQENNIEDFIGILMPQKLTKGQIKEIFQDLLKQVQKLKKSTLNQANEQAEKIIKDANNLKSQIVLSAQISADQIIRVAKNESLKIIEDAKKILINTQKEQKQQKQVFSQLIYCQIIQLQEQRQPVNQEIRSFENRAQNQIKERLDSALKNERKWNEEFKKHKDAKKIKAFNNRLKGCLDKKKDIQE